jgi:hypothetical protein
MKLGFPTTFAATFLTAFAAQAQQAPTLPGGATSLQEIYQDWRVACQVADNAKRCVLLQQQNQQNGQRVLAIELNAPVGNTVTGTLALPLGLALDAGVTFQIDDNPAPYFPLARFGQYFVSARDDVGKVISFSRAETKAQGTSKFGSLSDNRLRLCVNCRFEPELDCARARRPPHRNDRGKRLFAGLS